MSISRGTVERLRLMYPNGTRVQLEDMDDMQAPPIGTKGTVIGVDDTGSLMVHWDNGSSLNVLYGIDKVSCVGKEEQIDDTKSLNEDMEF